MKQESMKVLFFIRKSKLLKNGEAPIFLRVTVNGQQDEIRIRCSVPIKLWNNTKGCSKFSKIIFKGGTAYCAGHNEEVHEGLDGINRQRISKVHPFPLW